MNPIRLVLALLLPTLLAACGPQPPARIPSIATAADGGGEAQLRNVPIGTTNSRGGYGF